MLSSILTIISLAEVTKAGYRDDETRGEHGRWASASTGGFWFNHKASRIHDISSDFSGGTNDHVGYIWATKNGTKLGLTPKEVAAIKASEEGGGPTSDAAAAALGKIDENNTRIRWVRSSGSYSISLDTSGNGANDGFIRGQDALLALDKSGHPFPLDSIVEWSYNHGDKEVRGTLRDFLSSHSYRDF